MTMPQGASGLNPDGWLQEWIIRGGEAGNQNTATVVIPAASGASGTSGASGATGPVFFLPGSSGYSELLAGASGASGASGATGASGIAVTVSNLASFPNLHQREQSVVQALLRDSVPILGAWQGAQDAFANILLGGFTSVENFIEVLWKILTGQEIDLTFITDGAREILELLGAVFGPVGNFFEWLWENIGEDIIREVLGFLGWVWNEFGSTANDILQAIFGFLKWLFDLFGGAIDSLLKPIFSFLKDVFETFDVDGFLKPVIDLIFGFWDAVGGPVLGTIGQLIIDIFDAVPEWIIRSFFDTIKTVWTALDTLFIENIVQLLINLSDNDDVFDIIQDVISFFGDVIADAGSLVNGIPLLGDIIDLVGGWVLGIINGLTGGLFSVITEALGALIEWGTKLPLIGPLLSALIPDEWENSAGQPAASFVDLKEYAAETLNTSSVLYARNLQGEIPADLLPVVSPGLVGDSTPNLVADSGFKSAAAVQAGQGWSWDATVSRVSGDGGSAKVVGDGGVKQMFSNLVAVSPGQSLECSVWARWTKPSAARPTISVGLRGYINEQVVFTQPVAAKSSVVENSTAFTGNVGGWVEVKATYAIPATQGLTHVRLVLSVLNAPSGTSVWFDDAALKKVSLIQQELVAGVSPGASNLADDIENSVGYEDYQALLDRVAKKTGASLSDVEATIEDFLDGDSTISGDQIKAGNIASVYINELRDTWDKVHVGVTGNVPAATGTVASALAALAGWRTVIASAGGLSSGAVATANDSARRVTVLESQYSQLKEYVGKMAVDIRAVALAAGIAPTTPPTPPGDIPKNFTSVNDNFDRASIGTNWSVAYKTANSGALIIPDNNNAFFDPPDVTTVQNVFTAVYAAGNSSTEYQRVFCTLGTAPSRPLVGSPGYNDLLGRVASPTKCIVARFYNDFGRTVRLFWRNGGWEDNPFLPSNEFGTFTMPSDLTSASVLEFYVGSKSGSDQTKCFVKVGTWTSAVATINSSVLSVMGRGWGFGGGNGVSIAAAQNPGMVNFWGAQDQ